MIGIRVPRVKDFYNPVLLALHNLGGSGTRKEILEEVVRNSDLTEEQLEPLLVAEDGRQSPIQYRVGYAQTYLKSYGLLENPSRGVWALTEEGTITTDVDPDKLERTLERDRAEKRVEIDDESFSIYEPNPIMQVSIPSLDKFFNPMLLVLHRLGGLGTNEEMNDGVLHILRLTNEQLRVLHVPEKGKQTEIEYRLTLARRYLKKYGLLGNPKPKTWELTAKGSAVSRVNPYAVILYYQQKSREENMQRESDIFPDFADIGETMSW